MKPTDPPSSARVLVLLAHPDLHRSRVNRRLAQAARDLPPGRVEVRDLYALYPDYALDVAAEQAALSAADLVVWLHPIQWYAPPALMKLWIDEVLTLGWAYGHGGDALQGKDLWLACSTGAREEAYHPTGYNRHFFDAFLPPLEQTAALCGLRFLPPLVLHGAHALDAPQIEAHAALFAQRLASYPDWPELATLPDCEACVTPDQDRPRSGDVAALS
ncbi:NAD(P)H-dependent oxidoreductase [Sphaerotilus mobilis]|uniref:glutathione-regulated potassium-efflux system oxidoreductase KefF n=1 Tax=Sphaerotilus mobilis TaxID=47994 RepID=UPI00102B8946|nr:NAD(P)H-dependent oxidoreductase [Sphaerotilus mobilis]